MKRKRKKQQQVNWYRQRPDGTIWICGDSLAGEVGVQIKPEKILSITCAACGEKISSEKHTAEWAAKHFLCVPSTKLEER